MKIILLLVAVYALIINQSLKQKESRSISAQVNMQNRPKPQNIRPDNNVYLNTSFQPGLTVKPLQSRRINTEKRNFPARFYKPYSFQQMNDLKEEANENMQQDVLYPLDYSAYSGLAPRDGSR
ncbi:MAG: hypothetical protein ACTHMV_15565 [Chitinophagaceae bacterium]